MYVKFDLNALFKKVLNDKLGEQGLNYRLLNSGAVEFYESLTPDQHQAVKENLEAYGIEIIEGQKTALVQRIKDIITEMVFSEDAVPVKASVYIAEKMSHSYGYLSNVFSEIANTSIESFIIMQRIEHAKHLIISSRQSLTEIAHKLNYSSVAHLSGQFKNMTGITPSQFQKIMARRRKVQHICPPYSKAV